MMKRKFFYRTVQLFSFSLLLAASVAFGQTDQGRIAGRVMDPNGAVIPGAGVTLTNIGTNEKRTVTANDSGEYILTPLRAAVYNIVAVAGAFAPKTVTNVHVAVGQQMNLDITLAAEAQTVTVDVLGGSETG